MGLATINIKFQADLRGFSTEMQNSMRAIGSFGKQMSDLGRSMSLYVTGPLLAGGAAAVKFASDYNESLNKVNVAFGPASNSVKEFAKTSLTSFGLSEGAALDAAATYGDMGTSMGLTTSQAAKMSTSLVGLAGDLASFKNIGIDQANTALASVFTGETESLKKLGIVMTEANLQSYALSQGIKTQYKDMDQASKVNLRYAFVMNATKNAQGDFARTGGGAANQMRIFQESLKQLAQQFGSVILPAFTKAITYVNGMITSFGSLSEGSKTLIIGIAGIAAATGPLLTVMGSMLTFVPNVITKFNALKDSFVALYAVILANPIALVATSIAALATVFVLSNSSVSKLKDSHLALNDAIKKGNQNATEEVGALDKLYSTATNVNVSIKERKQAVNDLQELYPSYFQNIKDESILNGYASKSYNELRDAIFNKARAKAIENELQNRANERVQEELNLRQKIEDTEKRIKELRSGNGNLIDRASLKDLLSFLPKQKAELQKFYADSKKEDELLFKAKEEYSNKTGKLGDDQKQKLDQITLSTKELKKSNDSLVPGTIDFYNAKIKKLEDEQNHLSTTEAKYYTLGNEIERYKKLIESISPQKVESILGMSVKAPETNFKQTADEFSKMVETISGKAEGLRSSFSAINTILDEYKTKVAETMLESVTSFTEGFANVVATWSNGGNLLAGVGNLFLSTLADMMVRVGKIAIETGIAISGIKKALLTLNPGVSIAAGIALVALGTMVKSQIAGSFTNGGIIGGTSYYGDKILARVNSGEMIANTSQQKAIWNSMSGGGAITNVLLNGSWEIDGTKLKLVLDRTEKMNSRKG